MPRVSASCLVPPIRARGVCVCVCFSVFSRKCRSALSPVQLREELLGGIILKLDLWYRQKPIIFTNFYSQYLVLFTIVPRSRLKGAFRLQMFTTNVPFGCPLKMVNSCAKGKHTVHFFCVNAPLLAVCCSLFFFFFFFKSMWGLATTQHQQPPPSSRTNARAAAVACCKGGDLVRRGARR